MNGGKNTNELIALGIAGGVLILGGVIGVVILIVPDEAIVFLETVPAKLVLSTFCWFLLVIGAVLFYFRIYTPTTRRMIANTWRLNASIAVLGCGTMIVGIPKIVASWKKENPGPELSLQWGDAPGATSATIIVAMILVLLTSALYFLLNTYEAKNGKLD